MKLDKYANMTHELQVKGGLSQKLNKKNPNQKITQDSPGYARGKRNKVLLAYLKHSIKINKEILKNYSCC